MADNVANPAAQPPRTDARSADVETARPGGHNGEVMPLMRPCLFSGCVARSARRRFLKQRRPCSTPGPTSESSQGLGAGQEKTTAGQAEATRNYRFFLEGNFIEERRTAIYSPQPENPDGETRQYLSLYHHNPSDDIYRMRQYYNRGFVVDFELTDYDRQERRYTWISTRVQNGSANLTVRYVVDIEDNDTFVETYELQRSPARSFAKSPATVGHAGRSERPQGSDVAYNLRQRSAAGRGGRRGGVSMDIDRRSLFYAAGAVTAAFTDTALERVEAADRSRQEPTRTRPPATRTFWSEVQARVHRRPVADQLQQRRLFPGAPHRPAGDEPLPGDAKHGAGLLHVAPTRSGSRKRPPTDRRRFRLRPRGDRHHAQRERVARDLPVRSWT